MQVQINTEKCSISSLTPVRVVAQLGLHFENGLSVLTLTTDFLCATSWSSTTIKTFSPIMAADGEGEHWRFQEGPATELLGAKKSNVLIKIKHLN